MRRNTGVSPLRVVLLLLGCLSAELPAIAGTIAWWRFEPGNFLADSSGNGWTLTNGGNVVPSSDVDPASGSSGSAAFSAAQALSYLSRSGFDLSPYQRVRVSWWMKPEASSPTALVFEHSPNFNSNPGGFLASVNESGGGGALAWRTSTSYNIDKFVHTVPDPQPHWEQWAVEFDRTANSAADAVKVYRGDMLLADQVFGTYRATNFAPFRNDVFVIGARGGGSSPTYKFTGKIDELKVESLPGPIAWWRFEPGDFLADSSGNGHTLAAGPAGTNLPTSSTDVSPSAPGTGSALFNGTNTLAQTAAALDLSAYRRIRVSAWVKVDGTQAGILWEHSPTFINKPGSIVADVNDPPPGTGKAGVWTTGGHYNLDNYPHLTNNTWQHLAVEYNRDAPSVDVTRVFINGTLVGTNTSAFYADTVAFLNDTFFLGARRNASGGNPGVFFKGSLDEVKIEEVLPAPPPAVRPTKLFIIAGQSNALGQASTTGLPASLLIPQSNVSIYNRTDWMTLQPGLGADATQFGPELTFGRDIATLFPDEHIGLIKYAVGATALWDDWKATAPRGQMYTDLLKVIQNALADLGPGPTPEIAGVVWMQGESDALEGHGAEYEANLTSFIQQLRADLGIPGLIFGIGQITHNWPNAALVMQAQANVCATIPLANLVYTDDLVTGTQNHYDTNGMMILGSRFAKAMVPEPGSGVLLLLGLGGAGLVAWSKKRRVSQ